MINAFAVQQSEALKERSPDHPLFSIEEQKLAYQQSNVRQNTGQRKERKWTNLLQTEHFAARS